MQGQLHCCEDPRLLGRRAVLELVESVGPHRTRGLELIESLHGSRQRRGRFELIALIESAKAVPGALGFELIAQVWKTHEEFPLLLLTVSVQRICLWHWGASRHAPCRRQDIHQKNPGNWHFASSYVPRIS